MGILQELYDLHKDSIGKFDHWTAGMEGTKIFRPPYLAKTPRTCYCVGLNNPECCVNRDKYKVCKHCGGTGKLRKTADEIHSEDMARKRAQVDELRKAADELEKSLNGM